MAPQPKNQDKSSPEPQFPLEKDVPNLPKIKVKFNHVQSPGMDVEFTKGRTVMKNNGRLGTIYESYHIRDGEEVELTHDVAKHLSELTYPEAGQKKPRFILSQVF